MLLNKASDTTILHSVLVSPYNVYQCIYNCTGVYFRLLPRTTLYIGYIPDIHEASASMCISKHSALGNVSSVYRSVDGELVQNTVHPMLYSSELYLVL